MIELKELRYCRLGTSDLDGAERFATEILGLEIADRTRNAIYFKSDDRDHTLCYFEGDPKDQSAAFDIGTPEEMRAAAAELEAIGHPVRVGTREECDQRRVREFIAFADPSGNRFELVVRPAYSGRHYRGTRDAGVTGFSHIGIRSTDVVRDEHFWTRVCNARVSDRVADAPLLRIDAVHHSLAVVPGPEGGLHHINHQVMSNGDIMRSNQLLLDHQVPIVFGPGRHPASSAQFLYFHGHDNLVFEYSVGVRLINDEPIYRERDLPNALEGMCEWGAKPAQAIDIRK